jgi:hypothetical protein
MYWPCCLLSVFKLGWAVGVTEMNEVNAGLARASCVSLPDGCASASPPKVANRTQDSPDMAGC